MKSQANQDIYFHSKWVKNGTLTTLDGTEMGVVINFTSDGSEKVIKKATMSKVPFVEATWPECLYKYYCKNCFV